MTPILFCLYISLESDAKDCHFKLKARSPENKTKIFFTNKFYSLVQFFACFVDNNDFSDLWSSYLRCSFEQKLQIQNPQHLKFDWYFQLQIVVVLLIHLRLRNFFAYIIHKVDLDYSDRTHFIFHALVCTLETRQMDIGNIITFDDVFGAFLSRIYLPCHRLGKSWALREYESFDGSGYDFIHKIYRDGLGFFGLLWLILNFRSLLYRTKRTMSSILYGRNAYSGLSSFSIVVRISFTFFSLLENLSPFLARLTDSPFYTRKYKVKPSMGKMAHSVVDRWTWIFSLIFFALEFFLS